MITGSLGLLPSASIGNPDGPGPVRARPRLGAGHRRPGRREPARDVPVRRDDAPPRTRLGFRGRRPRIGRSRGARRVACAPATWAARPRRPRRPARCWPTSSARSRRHSAAQRGHLDERRVRALGGRPGSRAHARAALRHRRSSRASAATTPRSARRSSATRTTSSGCSARASSTTWTIPFDREQIRQATLETIARNDLRSCYIRPLVFRGYGTMGLFPLDARVDVAIAVWEWGSYLGEEGKAERHPREGQLLAADQRRTR